MNYEDRKNRAAGASVSRTRQSATPGILDGDDNYLLSPRREPFGIDDMDHAVSLSTVRVKSMIPIRRRTRLKIWWWWNVKLSKRQRAISRSVSESMDERLLYGEDGR